MKLLDRFNFNSNFKIKYNIYLHKGTLTIRTLMITMFNRIRAHMQARISKGNIHYSNNKVKFLLIIDWILQIRIIINITIQMTIIMRIRLLMNLTFIFNIIKSEIMQFTGIKILVRNIKITKNNLYGKTLFKIIQFNSSII